jgi:hypothetical protein
MHASAFARAMKVRQKSALAKNRFDYKTRDAVD